MGKNTESSFSIRRALSSIYFLNSLASGFAVPSSHSLNTSPAEAFYNDRLSKRQVDYSSIDPRKHMCELALHRATLSGSTLLVHGGYVGYIANDQKIIGPNSVIRAIDFSQDFKLSSRDDAPVKFLQPPNELPETSGHVLFSSGSTIFEFSGVPEHADKNWPGWNEVNRKEYWGLDLGKKKHFKGTVKDSILGEEYHIGAHSYYTQVPGTSKGYVLGGFAEDDGDKSEKRYLSVFEMDKREWKRYDTGFTRIDYGEMVYLPVGERGLLVLIGGRNSMAGLEDSPAQFSPMNRISVMNLNAVSDNNPEGVWVMQEATAADPKVGLPSARSNACAWVVSAPDGSSHQIYVYGGFQWNKGPPHQFYKDLWVLSIPSFEWILIDDGSSGPSDPGYDQLHPGQREGLSCTLINKSTMVMFGGRAPPDFSRKCETTNIYAFDMNRMSWVEEFRVEDSKKEYKVPEVVYNVIGGDRNGGSKKTPNGGLSDLGLRRLFTQAQTPPASKPAPKDDSNDDKTDNGSGGDDGRDADQVSRPSPDSPSSTNPTRTSSSPNSKTSNTDSSSKDKSNDSGFKFGDNKAWTEDQSLAAPSNDGTRGNNPDADANRDSTNSGTPAAQTNTPTIIGAACGGIAGIILVIAGVIICMRKARHRDHSQYHPSPDDTAFSKSQFIASSSSTSALKISQPYAGSGYSHSSHSRIEESHELTSPTRSSTVELGGSSSFSPQEVESMQRMELPGYLGRMEPVELSGSGIPAQRIYGKAF